MDNAAKLFDLIRVVPKDLYKLPGRANYSIQWQRKLIRDIRHFVDKTDKQFVSVQDVADFYQAEPETIYRQLFPNQIERKRKPSNQNEIQGMKKAL